MSEPVTNVEIEDVLSSIRRLITDDGVTERKPTKTMTDRFVLTPALRVMDGGSSKPSVGRSATKARKDVSSKPVKGAAGQKADVGGPEPTVAAFDTEWEHVTEGGTGTAAPFRTSRLALEARIAELEAAVARSREEWEPDGSEPDAKEMPSRHLFAQSVTDDVAGDVDGGSATELSDRSATVADEGPGLTVGGSRSEVVEGAGANSVAADLAGKASDELADEDFLHEFIAEIVRQELQGDLGERITRNVRRMVRREIQQAMALKGIE